MSVVVIVVMAIVVAVMQIVTAIMAVIGGAMAIAMAVVMNREQAPARAGERKEQGRNHQQRSHAHGILLLGFVATVPCIVHRVPMMEPSGALSIIVVMVRRV